MTKFRATWNDGGTPLTLVWRSLAWKEFRSICELTDSSRLRHILAYQLCVLRGPILGDAPAGIVEWIGNQQVESSFFHQEYQRMSNQLTLARNALMGNVCEAAKAIIAWAFRYSFEEIDSWDSTTFLSRWVQAEYILGRTIDLRIRMPLLVNSLRTGAPDGRAAWATEAILPKTHLLT